MVPALIGATRGRSYARALTRGYQPAIIVMGGEVAAFDATDPAASAGLMSVITASGRSLGHLRSWLARDARARG